MKNNIAKIKYSIDNFNSSDNNNVFQNLLWPYLHKSFERDIENYVKDFDNINSISLQLETKLTNLAKKEFLLKSSKLYKKLTMKDGLLKLNKKDLEVFKIDYETNNHIILKHIDNKIGYMVKVSILKFYPKNYGNFLYYKVSYFELRVNYKLKTKEYLLINEVLWAEQVNFELLGNGNNTLELIIKPHYLDYKRDLNLPALKILLIHPSLLNNEYNQFINLHYWNIFINKDNNSKEVITNLNNSLSSNKCDRKICNVLMNAANLINNLNKENRFIIYNKLVKLDSRFINKIIEGNTNINNGLIASTEIINKNQNFIINRFLIKIVKFYPKIYGNLQLDIENNIIKYNKFNLIKKMCNLNIDENVFDIKKIDNVPVIFFNKHIYNNIYNQINLEILDKIN